MRNYVNFTPDSGKYEIVMYVCTCVGERVYSNTPLKRVAEEVVGWAAELDSLEAGEMWNRGLLPLRPVVLTLDGLTTRVIAGESELKIGSPRLAPIGQAHMTHAELIHMHRAYHEQD